MQNVKPELNPVPIFLDMDGATDDLISLITLLSLPNFKLTGVSVTNGNCHVDKAVNNVLRVLSLFSNNTTEVAVSAAEPVNPFPIQWRDKCDLIKQLDLIKTISPDTTKISGDEAADFTANKILSENEKSTIILTGPATNLITAIEKYPGLTDKIERVLWMAGAFMANGNVNSPDHDGSAEWNIFWDPLSAQKLLHSGLKIILFPLDVCNQVPVDNYLMYHLKNQSKYKLSKLVYAILEKTVTNHAEYCMWDVLPALFLGFPDIVRLSGTSIEIEQRGTSKGNIFKTSKGSPIHFASWIDDEKFYTDFTDLMRTF